MRFTYFFPLLIVWNLFFFSCHEKKENTNTHLTLEDLGQWNDRAYSLSSRRIRQSIDSLRLRPSGLLYADQYTRAYYASRHPFLWITRSGIDRRADTLLAYLEQAATSTGLPPSCFKTDELRACLHRIRQLDFDGRQDLNATFARAEYLLTTAYVRYACGQRFGYIRPDRTFNRMEKTDTTEKAPYLTLYDIPTETAGEDFIRQAISAQKSGDFTAFFHEIAPRADLYRLLTAEYGRTDDPVKRQKIAVNIERSRWRTAQPEGKFVWVNLAGMHLYAVDGESGDTLDMKVCIGNRTHKSPMLQSQIERVEMNPYWNIPYSIIKNEIATRHAGDVSYFSRNRYRIIDKVSGEELDPATVTSAMLASGQYRVRQDNGEGNSLGRLIFRFPNDFSIFLHDTDNKAAFKRSQRAISHGCIRVEKPLELAVFLMEDPDEEHINAIRTAIGLPPLGQTEVEAGGDETPKTGQQRFRPPVPLFIQYYTFLPALGGGWEDSPDPYGYDKVLLEKMNAF